MLDLEYQHCPHDGTALKRIGEEVSERLEIIPAKFKVIKTIRPKYVCPCCESFHIHATKAQLIPKSNASASLLAFIAVAKYADALPLYRQEAQLARFGVELPRQTMARWMIKVGAKITPLIELLRRDLLANSSYIHMDETTVQVLKEDGKRADQKSYMAASACRPAWDCTISLCQRSPPHSSGRVAGELSGSFASRWLENSPTVKRVHPIKKADH